MALASACANAEDEVGDAPFFGTSGGVTATGGMGTSGAAATGGAVGTSGGAVGTTGGAAPTGGAAATGGGSGTTGGTSGTGELPSCNADNQGTACQSVSGSWCDASAGSCVCAADHIVCNGACVYRWDSSHCGDCTTVCQQPSYCQSGQGCVTP